MAKAQTAEKTPDKPAKAPKASKAVASKPNVFARLGQYFKDVRGEMRRIVWPTGTEVRSSSIVVVVTLVFFATGIFLFDSLVLQTLKLIRGLG